MKKLLELEEKLKKAKEELEKQMGISPAMDEATGMPPGTAAIDAGVNKNDKEDKEEEAEDKKEDKDMIEDKMDEHNEDKHGEAKGVDSAKKSYDSEVMKFQKNGQWSL